MRSEHARHWELDPGVIFLNHGSFGATPRPVLDAQQAWRARLEAEPVRFMVEELEPALDGARARLGRFLHAEPDDLAYLPNATTGVNTVLRSLQLAPGDELLTIDHEYNAVRNALQFVAERAGARVVTVPVPFPLSSADELVGPILAAVTPRTRLAVLDHVTSATALVLPIERLVRELERPGVDVLVDGAHAPGMLDLDLATLGAAYYTGNLHKWVCAPKGAAFLWVRPDRQAQIHPLVISHGANSRRDDRSRFRLEFDWQGTSDPTAWLSVPAALAFGASLVAGGWAGLRERNHELALRARARLCEVVGEPAPAPDEMVGSMASVPLPWESSAGVVQGVDLYGDRVHGALLSAGIQVMVTPWPQRPEGRRWRRLLRVSAAAYNDISEVEVLAGHLSQVLETVA
jgi:isopenicillin-N epimerase